MYHRVTTLCAYLRGASVYTYVQKLEDKNKTDSDKEKCTSERLNVIMHVAEEQHNCTKRYKTKMGANNNAWDSSDNAIYALTYLYICMFARIGMHIDTF